MNSSDNIMVLLSVFSILILFQKYPAPNCNHIPELGFGPIRLKTLPNCSDVFIPLSKKSTSDILPPPSIGPNSVSISPKRSSSPLIFPPERFWI